MSDKELDTFAALNLLTAFFIENKIGAITMAYMIDTFMMAIDGDETPRMALALSKNVLSTDIIR